MLEIAFGAVGGMQEAASNMGNIAFVYETYAKVLQGSVPVLNLASAGSNIASTPSLATAFMAIA